MRLIIAARLSRKRRDGKPQLGIDTQDKRAREWAEENGHTVVATVPDTKSGTTAPWDRKNLRPWVACGCDWCKLSDGKRGLPERKRVYDTTGKIAMYDGVLAYKTDRLSRGDQEDFTRIEGWATHHGKKLIIADGPQYPARDDSDYWRWAAETRAARVEWESIRERITRNLAERESLGLLNGKPPWGYVPDGSGGLTPTDAARECIPQVFAKIIAGESLAAVARWLGARAARTFHPKTITDMLWCATYLGERRNKAGQTVLTCEPVLITPAGIPDWASFRRAQQVQKDKATRQHGGPLAKNPAMLATAIFCGNPDCTASKCDEQHPSPMYRIIPPRDDPRTVTSYRCSGRGSDRHGCGNVVPAAFADMAVSAIIARAWDTPVTAWTLIPGDDHRAEIEQVRDALEQLPKRGLSRQEHRDEQERLWAEQDRLEALEPEPDGWDVAETGEGTWAGLWDRTPPGERGRLLRKRRFTVYATRDLVRLEHGEGDWRTFRHYDRELGVLGADEWDDEGEVTS